MEDLDTLVLRTVVAWQSAGIPVLLVTVTRTWGSSPRPPGSLMAINGRGETVGSVSGGCIEDDLILQMRNGGVQAATNPSQPTILLYGITTEQAHRSGLPCGGTVQLVLEVVSSHSQINELPQACVQRQSTVRRLDLHTGQVQLSISQSNGVLLLDDNHLTTYFGPQARLIVIGAGDLSLFLCQMALSLGFEVIVCEPRGEHRVAWRLDQVAVSGEMPDDLIVRLRPDVRTAIVAVTHDPKLDDLALIEALQSDAFYVGAIGSRRHSAMRKERLHTHFNLSQNDLHRLHGPTGLFIGSKTPAEIALSIMAEVVATKNGVRQSAPLSIAAGKSLFGSADDSAFTAASCTL